MSRGAKPVAPGTPPQPFGAYLPSQNTVLAYLKQPAGSAALRVQLRVKYASINTGSAGDGTWVEDGNTGAQLTPWYQGWALLEDVGMTSLVDEPEERHMLNQYVWLAGMPVAVVKTTLNASSQRVATPTQCLRNDEAEPCGTYFIVNDALPKPVALIDSAGRLAGSGEYDVFGRVNEVTVSHDTPAAPGTPPQPFGAYLPSQNTVLAYLKQPAGSAALRVQLRVKYASINTGSAGDGTWVEDGNTGAQLTPWYQGWALGQKTTPWLAVASNGLVHVRWQSDGAGESASYSGVTVGSYEYRRYEAGASPPRRRDRSAG